VSFEMVYTHGSLARLETLLGRPEAAERDIEEAGEIRAFGQHRVWQLEDGIFLAYTTGRYDDGRRDMETAVAALPEPERDATLWWSLLKSIAGEADRADAARRRRRTAEAGEAVATGRRFAELLRQSTTAAIEADGPGPMTAATLRIADAEEARLEGRPDPAAWAAAVDARGKLEQPWELAYARYRHAEAILGSGRPARDAATPLRAAYATARGLGAAPLRLAIEALASRARIRLEVLPDGDARAEPRAGTDLTARELEVLALVAAGHTNREIGDRLFISEKTASVHVTHAMNKLGALSRYEAAAAATRQGLLDAT
jgi:DNA-binding CsgD family transcriptional regulator